MVKKEEEKVEDDTAEEKNPALNLTEILKCAKDILPTPGAEDKDSNLCEVHIVGTPELILKILKVE